jgi:O-antigen/teichoic acid export membrane protein
VILSVAFMSILPSDRALGKITGTVIPVIVVGLWCYITILRSGKVIFKKEYWLYALKIGLPTIPHGLAMVLLARMDMVMILSICGASDAGIYSTGYTIATLLSVITNAIGQAWLPWFNEQLHIEKKEAIKKNNLLLMQLGCFLTLGFIVVAPEATKILCHSKFWDCIFVIPPVAIGTLCQYFYTNYVNVELYYKKTFIIALNSVIAAFLNYILNSIYIPRFGFVAAAYTTLVGYFALKILHYLSTRWILKIKIYSDAAYFGMMIGTGILGIGILFLYDTILLRYGISILLLGFFAFMKRNDIMLLADIIKMKLGRKS